jgi:hypothetical protein
VVIAVNIPGVKIDAIGGGRTFGKQRNEGGGCKEMMGMFGHLTNIPFAAFAALATVDVTKLLGYSKGRHSGLLSVSFQAGPPNLWVMLTKIPCGHLLKPTIGVGHKA